MIGDRDKGASRLEWKSWVGRNVSKMVSFSPATSGRNSFLLTYSELGVLTAHHPLNRDSRSYKKLCIFSKHLLSG